MVMIGAHISKECIATKRQMTVGIKAIRKAEVDEPNLNDCKVPRCYLTA